MSTLRIHLLGNFRLYQDLSSQETRIIPNIQTLLALLLIQRDQMHSREKIASLLWEDSSEERAHSRLNTTLWRLRKILEPEGIPAGTYLISTPNKELGFNFMGDCWVDIIEFEKIAQKTTTSTYSSASYNDIQLLEQTVSMYKGDLLDGYYYDWILRERERLHLAYIDSLYYLLNFYQHHKDYDKAIRWGQQILLADPLREDVHRNLIQLYTQNGQRALGVRQYHQCRKILQAELHIEPMPETQRAYYQIFGKQGAKSLSAQDNAQVDQIVERLHNALDNISQVQKNLQEILTRLDS